MVSLARYRGVLIALLGLAAATASMDLLLRWAWGLSPRPLYENTRLQPWNLDQAGSKVSGIVAERRLGRRDPSRGLGAIVGLSTAEAAIDPEILEAEAGAPLRWVNLYDQGGGFEKVAEIAEVLSYCEPRPSVVILAINPLAMAEVAGEAPLGVNRTTSEARAALTASLSAGRAKEAIKALRDLALAESWVLRNRPRTSRIVQVLLYRNRLALTRACRLGGEALFRPDPAPWKRHEGYPHRSHWVPTRTAFLLDKYWPSLGLFEPKNFAPDGPQAARLAESVAHIHGLGARLVVALMPEDSSIRARVPGDIRRHFDAALAAAVAPGRPPIIDLQTVVPDDRFSDPLHVDLEGRTILTHLLARRLRPILTGMARGDDRD